MIKKTLIRHLRRIVLKVPWPDRRSKVISNLTSVVEEVLPDGWELTPEHIDLLHQLVIPVIREAAPKRLNNARQDLAAAAADVIKLVCSGHVVPAPEQNKKSLLAKAKATVAMVRRFASRA